VKPRVVGIVRGAAGVERAPRRHRAQSGDPDDRARIVFRPDMDDEHSIGFSTHDNEMNGNDKEIMTNE
jgi:hypothetical protein